MGRVNGHVARVNGIVYVGQCLSLFLVVFSLPIQLQVITRLDFGMWTRLQLSETSVDIRRQL